MIGRDNYNYYPPQDPCPRHGQHTWEECYAYRGAPRMRNQGSGMDDGPANIGGGQMFEQGAHILSNNNKAFMEGGFMRAHILNNNKALVVMVRATITEVLVGMDRGMAIMNDGMARLWVLPMLTGVMVVNAMMAAGRCISSNHMTFQC